MQSGPGSPYRHVEGELDIPEEFRVHLVPQQYATYSPQDHAVWRDVLARNRALLMEREASVHRAYLAGIRELELPLHIPSIDELNERLASTGWRTVCVDGYIPSSAYVGLMSLRIFLVSRRIRRREHIDFAPAPDLVH